jgi:serine/threonine protein kinase
MVLKGVRAGRFHPRCTQCNTKFDLHVHGDGRITTHALSDRAGETLTPAISVALGIDAPAAARAAMPAATATAAPSQTAPPPAAPRSSETMPPPDVAETSPKITAPTSNTATTAPPASGGGGIPLHVEPPPDSAPSLTGRLGGYDLLRKLGQGGMGSVYLARQLSLNRNVALKVLLSQFAKDPAFIARFIREAYAAAQLNHHNVVQIHDIGAQKQTHFFSMELVEGQSLANLIREHGPMDPEEAVGYILQAARGLKFAHEHGLIHRDVKPENLLVNRHGIVKVADLGLVKTPDSAQEQPTSNSEKLYESEKTQLNVSMGTPAYMPPEQARDAHNVDVRADIYALGCTLYALLTGRPPFTGNSAVEVISKHLREQVTPPDKLVHAVPQYLSKVILKMLAKRPGDRYQDMTEVIQALQEFLGVETSGPFEPSEEQIHALRACVVKFNGSTWAKVKQVMASWFLPACGLLILGALFLPVSPIFKFRLVSSLIGFAAMTPLAYLAISGYSERTYMFDRAREFVVEGGIFFLFCLLGGIALFAAVLYVLDIHVGWMVAAGAAVAIGWLFHFLIDSSLAEERVDPLARAEALLKPLRLEGINEAAIQQFVCRHAGEKWEEFYEALFGYESKIMARREWGRLEALERKASAGDRGRPRPMYAAWRDPIIEWIDSRQRARRQARDRHYLEMVQREYLRAQGYPDSAAEKKARQVAMTMVIRGAELREAALEKVMQVTTPPAALPPDADKLEAETDGGDGNGKLKNRKAALGDEGLEGFEHLSYFQRRYGGWAGFFLAPPVRFVLGVILMAGCLTWARQNDLMPTDMDLGGARSGSDAPASVVNARPPVEPLKIGAAPRFLTRWFGGWQAGTAGLLLALSMILNHPRAGLYMIPAALVIIIGAAIAPNIGFIHNWMIATAAGAGIALMGVRATRE